MLGSQVEVFLDGDELRTVTGELEDFLPGGVIIRSVRGDLVFYPYQNIVKIEQR